MVDDEFNPSAKPLFLSKASAESAPYAGADDVPTFDHEFESLPELDTDLEPRGKGPSRGYVDRWREIARLHALGYTNNQICAHLGYSAPGVSLALAKPFVQAEIAKFRERMTSEDAVTILKRSSTAAALRLERSIMDPRDRHGHDAAKFVTEKVTGKARQEISVESGTLSQFTDLLRGMMERGESIDVTPRLPEARSADGEVAAETASRFDDWLDAELK